MNRQGASSRPLALAALLLCAGPLAACNVPVFRYALERWRPQPYEVVVFHKGSLGAKEKKALQALDAAAANLDVKLLDPGDELDEAARKLFAEQENPVLPWVVVRATDVDKRQATVWAGRLSEDAVSGLLDSPARREIVRRILAGETAVWLLLESGDRANDDEAAGRLRAELKRLTPQLKLPKLTDSPDDRLSAHGPPLRVAFSVLRLRRDDPAERALVSMLLASEPDLPGRKEPMAFAAFGRGYCLAALVGRGLSAENVRKCCTVLLAPCTCDVQGDLPRFDLLTRVDWQEAVTGERQVVPASYSPEGRGGDREPRPVPGAGKGTGGGVAERVPLPQPRAHAAVTESTPPEEGDGEEVHPLLSRKILLPAAGVAALLVLVTGAWALLSGRRKLG